MKAPLGYVLSQPKLGPDRDRYLKSHMDRRSPPAPNQRKQINPHARWILII